MNGNNNFEDVSFDNFLQNKKIVIPLIQREYAQGRDDVQGKEVRKNFVPELVRVLTGEKSLKLDFVFGVAEDGKKFIPLDGQQRLTTLLLMYWYFGKHNAEWTFTYESRRMANSFVKNLLSTSYNMETNRAEEPSKWIKEQEWFFENWLTDPTVSGMLTMLDAIHKEASEKNCEATNLNKITFDLYPIGELDADNAYTKMNARGEPLTEWENIKALLDKKIQDFCFTDNPALCMQNTCSLGRWPKDIDGDWLFKLEEYAQLNPSEYETLYSNQREANPEKKAQINKEIEKKLDNDIKKINCAFRNIFDLAVCIDLAKQINKTSLNEENYKGNLSSIQSRISSFHKHKTLLSDYAECVNRRIFDIATDLFQTLLALKDSVLKEYWDYLCYWSPKEKKSLTEVFLFNEDYSYTDCIRFYAMCRCGTESTEDWLRIIRNIIENGPNIDKDNFADAVALIDELAPNRENIINHLAHKKIESRFANEQLQEECEKAKQIIASQNNQCEGPQKEEILVAEEFAFFNGAIRFLYTDADGKTNWSQFKQKFENAKLYFNKSGVTEDYRVEAKLLRAFLAKFEDINFWFGNGKNFWRRTLLDKNYIAGVYSLLNGELNIPDNAKLWLTNNTLFDDAIVGDGDRDAQWCIQKNWNGCLETLTRYARKESRTIKNPRQVIPLSDWRARVLQSLGVGDNECTSQRRGGKYFIDWVTEFEYKGVKIKLVEGNQKSVFLNGESVEDKDVQDEFKKLAGEAY